MIMAIYTNQIKYVQENKSFQRTVIQYIQYNNNALL